MKKSSLTLVAFASLLGACKEEPAPQPKVEEPQILPVAVTLSPEEKSCVDVALNKAMDDKEKALKPKLTSTKDKIEAVNEALLPALQSCNLDNEKKDLYLKATGILLGLLPDSTESTELKVYDLAIDINDLDRGVVKKVFENGSIRFDSGDTTSTIHKDSLARRVVRRGGIEAYTDVISKDAKIGLAKEVYANGLIVVDWYDGSRGILSLSLLSPQVSCFEGVCEGDEVISTTNSKIGTVRYVYANGSTRVNWDDGSATTGTPTSELSPQAKPPVDCL